MTQSYVDSVLDQAIEELRAMVKASRKYFEHIPANEPDTTIWFQNGLWSGLQCAINVLERYKVSPEEI